MHVMAKPRAAGATTSAPGRVIGVAAAIAIAGFATGLAYAESRRSPQRPLPSPVSFTYPPPPAAAVPSWDATSGGGIPLATYAHQLNTDFIDKVTAGQARSFVPSVPPALLLPATGTLQPIDATSTKFFTYESINGWNNQLLNLFYAIDISRQLGRTLIVPPFHWPRRRGDAAVSVGRLLDLGSLSRLLPVVAEDEHGSVAKALEAAGATIQHIPGEGQPHRKRGMPRWRRDEWVEQHRGDGAAVLRVSCCLMWSWLLPDDVARELYAAVVYHPSLVSAAAAASAPLGAAFGALHVRRGDKTHVDQAYRDVFGKMTPAYFLRLMADAPAFAFGGAAAGAAAAPGALPAGAPLFVATDELDRGWFAPLAAAGHPLAFVDSLDQAALLTALAAFPQPLWADVLAILEQLVCLRAAAFVGTLPSTLSGHVVNARAVAAARTGAARDAAEAKRPLFVKLHESCCDARTAEDLLRLPGVRTLSDVPCSAHEPWC